MNSNNTNTRVIQIIGTRPQFIKCIPELGLVVNTGQHYDYDMVDVTTKFDYTTVKREGLKVFLLGRKPKLVVVYGDTKSTLWGAEVAHELGIPIAHIEAGVRDNSAKKENKIRKIVDHLATINFAPTPLAMDNLRRENLGHTAVITGDVLYDDYIQNRIHAGYAIVTIHRAENANKSVIDSWMGTIISKHKQVYVFLHHRTKKFFAKWKNKAHLLAPVDHQSMMFRLRDAERVYTDSGGLQKEAYWSGVPVTTINGNPWPEIYTFGFGEAKEIIITYVKNFTKA